MKWSQAMSAIALGIAMHTASAGEDFIPPEPIVIGSPEFKKICEAVHNKTGLLLDGQEVCEISTDNGKNWTPVEQITATPNPLINTEGIRAIWTLWGAVLLAGATILYRRRRQQGVRLEMPTAQTNITPTEQKSEGTEKESKPIEPAASIENQLVEGIWWDDTQPPPMTPEEQAQDEINAREQKQRMRMSDIASVFRGLDASKDKSSNEYRENFLHFEANVAVIMRGDSWHSDEDKDMALQFLQQLWAKKPETTDSTLQIQANPAPVESEYITTPDEWIDIYATDDDVPKANPPPVQENKPHVQSRLVPEKLMKVSSLRATARSVLQQKKAPEASVVTSVDHVAVPKKPVLKSTNGHIKPIQTVHWAQFIVDYVITSVNNKGWTEDIIPEITHSIEFLFSNTEKAIETYLESISDYFQKYGYSGKNNLEDLKSYFTTAKIQNKYKSTIRKSFESIQRAFLSLEWNKERHVPAVMKIIKQYTDTWPVHVNSLDIVRQIETAVRWIANNLTSLEKSYADFVQFTESQTEFKDTKSDNWRK